MIYNIFVYVIVIVLNVVEFIEILYFKFVFMDLMLFDIVYVYDGRLLSKCLNNGDVILKNNICNVGMIYLYSLFWLIFYKCKILNLFILVFII